MCSDDYSEVQKNQVRIKGKIEMQPDFTGKIVTVFGGTGFLGRYVAVQLAQAGAQVKIVTRHRASAYFLRPYGAVGQIVPVSAQYMSLGEIEALVKGSFAVVNCLGILRENGAHANFSHVHTDMPLWIAKACVKMGVPRFIHISSLGANKSLSEYAISKFAGENLGLDTFPDMTILRPSVIFGAEDNFFNMFARMAKILPALPLIGGGKTRFQPVYVMDVAKAVVHTLGDIRSCGHIFELGGPEILTFKNIMERLLSYTGQKRFLLPMPWWLARAQAFIMSVLPNPPLTNDQITSLETDNVVNLDALGFKDLGIVPTSIDSVVPTYIRSHI